MDPQNGVKKWPDPPKFPPRSEKSDRGENFFTMVRKKSDHGENFRPVAIFIPITIRKNPIVIENARSRTKIGVRTESKGGDQPNPN